MIKLSDLLKEEKQTYDYGCVMLYFNFPEMEKIHTLIDPVDIYTEEGDRSYGLEDEPHTTLLYGLHEGVSDQDIKNVLGKFEFGPCIIQNASTFNNEKYDVLKFDVKGDNLHEANEELKKYPYTSNFPDYHPHMTIAYLKPGKAKKYIAQLSGQEFELIPTHAVYSKPNGDQVKLIIKVNK
jgi:2'-5' RNA ligase